ncbi:UNVERIFIED_CONTAM: hypothetical protein GTU68_001586 [Idotea baltica]|nr:hypothetical protein [Idotea baltica]
MLHGISTNHAMRQLRKEGLKNLYRGILPPLGQKTISTSIMFGMFEKYKVLFRSHCPFLGSRWCCSCCSCPCWCTEAILCPLERIQVILQDKKFHGLYKNTLHCATELNKFGFSEYYRGLYLILLRNSASNILFFGLRKEIKEAVPPFGDSWYDHFLFDFLSGALLGAFISTIMYPTNVVKSHQQSQVGGPFQSIHGTFLDVYEARGRKLRKLFKGVHVNYTRALLSWGIINASYEILLRNFYS